MSKRQIRINDPVILRQRINEFIGKNINLIFKDKTVLVGTLKRVRENEILLSNMRLKDIKFSFLNIAELYADIEP